jgi:hypothetical protein
MKGRKWLWSTLAAAAFAVGGLVGPAAAQDLAKCQKQIENNGRGFRDQVFKALQLCKDLYRTEVVKAQVNNLPAATLALNLDKKAPVCGKMLTSVLGTTGGGLGTATPKTQAEKYYKKFDDLVVTGKCTSSHLAQLGHLPSGQYGDAWIRWILVSQLKSAYEKQESLVADLPNIMNSLVDPDTANTGSCAIPAPAGDGKNYCAVLASSPCNNVNCRIDTPNTTLTINLCGLGAIPANLSGEIVQGYCQFPPWTGCDIAVVGNPSRSIDPVNFLTSDACSANVRAEGWIKGSNSCQIGYGGPSPGGAVTTFNVSSVISGPKDVSICQDADTTSGSNCTAGTLTLPGGTTPCSCNSTPPGPIEVTLSGSLAAGDSIASSALLIHTASAGAPPGVNCSGTTGDATFVPLFFTTGTVNVTVLDPVCGGVCGTSLSQGEGPGAAFSSVAPNSNSGPGPVNYLDSSDNSGAKTVGGFPGACPASLPSLATAFKIQCQ